MTAPHRCEISRFDNGRSPRKNGSRTSGSVDGRVWFTKIGEVSDNNAPMFPHRLQMLILSCPDNGICGGLPATMAFLHRDKTV